jgi:hypothetical protein
MQDSGDNTAGICIRTRAAGFRLMIAFFSVPLYIGMYSVTAHDLKFSLISLWKMEFLSLIIVKDSAACNEDNYASV